MKTNYHVSECPRCEKFLYQDPKKKLWMRLLPGSKRLFCPDCKRDYVAIFKLFEGPLIAKKGRDSGTSWVFQFLILHSADK